MDLCKQITVIYEQYGVPALTNFRVEDVSANAGYHVGVFALVDIDAKVVLIRRKPQPDYPGLETYWWLPGGGYEVGERLDETAVREFREETGLDIRIERLLLSRLLKDKQFFTFWFRGYVIGGQASPDNDPGHTTAAVRSFSPGDIPVGALWSDIDKIVLACESFIDFPVDAFLSKHCLEGL